MTSDDDINNKNTTAEENTAEENAAPEPVQEENPPLVDPAAAVLPADDMAEVSRIAGDRLRAVRDDDDGDVPDLSIYRIRIDELTESLMKSPQAVAISRLAYAEQVDRMVRNSNALQTALLWLAEDLGVELPSTRLNLVNRNVTEIKTRVVHDGSYRQRELMHIAILARKRIGLLQQGTSSGQIIEAGLRSEIADLKQQLATRQERLERLENIPPPPLVDNKSPYLLSYLDRRERRNYLGRQDSSFVRTRRLAEALRFPTPSAAALVLLELLRDIGKHAFPTAYRLEIGSLHLINQPFTGLDSRLQNELVEAKATAVKYEAEHGASKQERRRKRRHKNRKGDRT